MNISIPQPIAQKLEQTLAQWHNWRCSYPLPKKPEIVHQLGDGLSNYSILVEAKSRFVIRIDGLSPSLIGLNRQAEWRALHTANRAQLAPWPCYFNPELGTLVCEYLEPQEIAPESISELAALLHEIHQLPPLHFRLDIRERLLRYEKHIEHQQTKVDRKIWTFRDPVLRILEAVNANNTVQVLCHNDLLKANRIKSNDKLWAIDWEYAAMGNPWFELAVVCVGDELDDSTTYELIEHYLGQTPSPEQIFQLKQNECIYRYMELLWYAATHNTREENSALHLSEVSTPKVELLDSALSELS